MAKMFRTQTDDNGVSIDSNSHPMSEFTPPSSEQRPAYPHWMAGEDGQGGYLEPPAETIIHRTKDRVIGGQGSRPGAMTFGSDLLPRSERVSREEAGHGVEKHAAGCWCELCQARSTAGIGMQDCAPMPSNRARTHRK